MSITKAGHATVRVRHCIRDTITSGSAMRRAGSSRRRPLPGDPVALAPVMASCLGRARAAVAALLLLLGVVIQAVLGSSAAAVGGVDLQVSVSNDVGGTATLGTPWTWTWTITNTDTAPAIFADGQTILADNLPASGLGYGAPMIVTGSATGVTNIGNVTCVILANDLTCSASGASVTLAGPTGSFQVTLATTPAATGTYANPRTGGACGVDPRGVVAESNEGNNACSDSVTVIAPDLQITKSDNVNHVVPLHSRFTWSLAVANTGAGPATFADGQTILTDNLPLHNFYDPPALGNFFNVAGAANVRCAIADFDNPTLTCTASGGSVTLGPTTGSFVVSSSVLVTSPPLDNPRPGGACTVDPGAVVAETNEANNTCSDSVRVLPPPPWPDLGVAQANNVSSVSTVGRPWTWTLTISNPGQGNALFGPGQIILKDELPGTGLTYGSVTVGQGFFPIDGIEHVGCAVANSTLTCWSGDFVTMGQGREIIVYVVATPTAAGTYPSPRQGGVCAVDPANVVYETDEGDNACASNSVTVTAAPAPDLTIRKVNNSDPWFTPSTGVPWNWTLTVSNLGPGAATFAGGQTLLADELPTSGMTYGTPTVESVTNVTNPGSISCAVVNNTLTCTASGDGVTIGATNGSFAVKLSASSAAPGTVTNPRTGGLCAVDPGNVTPEAVESNNTCSNSITVLGPDLRAELSNNVGGQTTVGRPWTWHWHVQNYSQGPARFQSGQTILVDNLPSGGVAYGTPTVDSNGFPIPVDWISCVIENGTLICNVTKPDGFTFGGESKLYPGGIVDVHVEVTPTTTGVFANPRHGGLCTADPGMVIIETDESNNTCGDTVTVVGGSAYPDLRVGQTNNTGGSATTGTPFAWIWTVGNAGSAAATFPSGEIILTDNLPSSGATYGTPTVGSAAAVTNADHISCAITGSTLTCTASGANVALGAATGTFAVTVPVTPTAAGLLVSPRPSSMCVVDPSGVVMESDERNNTCGDTVSVSRILVSTSRAGPGKLTSTITAVGGGNVLREIRVGAARNATVEVAGRSGTGNFTVTLPGTPATVVLAVTRQRPGEDVFVPLVVVDQYGEWSTFVGAGAGAF